jgi:hypothetical protein
MNRWWMALLLVGCSSSSDGSDVCPTCEPEVIGDTGDLGGELTACWGNRAPEVVDAARAAELGFDVEGMERAASRPVDAPLTWLASEDVFGGDAASGYSSEPTTISVHVQSLRSYRHMRPDPQYCDGTTCRFPGATVPQSTCPRSLETDVRAEIMTADGAVRASLAGIAMQVIAGSEGEGDGLASMKAHIDASAPLSEVEGSLRVYPKQGAMGYRTRLRVHMRCSEDATTGSISPSVFIVETENTGTDYWPLRGSFPPIANQETTQSDAGAPR